MSAYKNNSWAKQKEDIGHRNVQWLNTGAGSSGFTSARHITPATINMPYSSEATMVSSSTSYSTNMTSIAGFQSAKGYLKELAGKRLAAEVDTVRQGVKRAPSSKVAGSMNANEENIELSARSLNKKIRKNPGKVTDKRLVGGQVNLYKLWGKQSMVTGGSGITVAMKQKQDIVPGLQKGEFVLLSSSPENRSSPRARISTSRLPGYGNHDNSKAAIVSSEAQDWQKFTEHLYS